MLNTGLNEMIRQLIERNKKKKKHDVSNEDHANEDRSIADKTNKEPTPRRSALTRNTDKKENQRC